MNLLSMFKVIFSSVAKLFETTNNIVDLGSTYVKRKSEQQQIKTNLDTETYATELIAEHQARKALAIAKLNEINNKAEKPSAETQKQLDDILAKINK